MKLFINLLVGYSATSVLLLFTPSSLLADSTKAAIGASGFVSAATGAIAYQSDKQSKRQKEQNKFKVDATKAEDKLRQLAAKERECDEALKLLEVAEIELASRKEEFEAYKLEEISELEAEKNSQLTKFEEMRRSLAAQIELEETDLLSRIELQERQLNREIKDEVEREAQRLRSEYQAKLAQEQAEYHAAIKRREELEIETEEKWKATEESIANERKQMRQKIQEEYDEAIAVISQEKEALLAELEAANREQLEAEMNRLRGEYESWLVPHCQEMDKLLKDIEALKGTICTLRDQISQDKDIKLCSEHGTVHGDRANSVLVWLKQNGQYCDYCSASVLPDGTFVLNFMPWESGLRAEKGIKGLLLAAQVRFGLQEPPVFQPNGEARAWTLTMFPARARAMALNDFYVQPLQETRLGTTFRDIEPVIRDGVARKLNYEQQVEEMMNFTPPVPLPRPRSFQITELEMMSFQWFFSWRGLATGKENITTREGLLWHVYGIREGRASATHDPLLMESLGDRVKRVLSILNAQARNLEETTSSENSENV